MAVSGKCYLSLHSDFASANRGACVQNCRRTYIVTDKESGAELEVDNEYIMSAKDLCTIDCGEKLPGEDYSGRKDVALTPLFSTSPLFLPNNRLQNQNSF